MKNLKDWDSSQILKYNNKGEKNGN
jgi:hypothetical protein